MLLSYKLNCVLQYKDMKIFTLKHVYNENLSNFSNVLTRFIILKLKNYRCYYYINVNVKYEICLEFAKYIYD